VTISRRIRWAGHVANMGDTRDAYRVLKEKREGKRLFRRPGGDGGIILEWIFEKWDWKAWTRSTCLRNGTGGGLLCMR
jgi:hypothetical protein